MTKTVTVVLNEKKLARLTETFWAVVKEQIGGNRDHGWGVKDSREVIDAIVAEDSTIANEEGLTLDKYSLSPEGLALITAVINPSQFRQGIEDKATKKGLLNKSEGRSGALKSLLSTLEV